MASDDEVKRYFEAIDEVVNTIPSFEEILGEMATVLEIIGLPEDVNILIGRKIALTWAAGESEEDTPPNIELATHVVRDAGWRLVVTTITGVSLFAGTEAVLIQVEITTAAGIGFSITFEEEEGTWRQDEWPTRGKYKLL